ncbi:MAG: fibronectin type III domain-containing protein [Flavobacteriaceae bacterium]|nr:fibronectin type III domain-containing protein [Flavobacteriaceae bacterium]NNL33191.1 fibronectin type III domain-containing protein [Flavobacteriaceae bacterium]
MIRKLLLLVFIIFVSSPIFSQRNGCDDNNGGEITVGASCVYQTWNNGSNSNYWDATGASCGETSVDDIWGWFDATSNSTTINYSPTLGDGILTLFTGACNAAMGSIACSDTGGVGVVETIVYATTIGIRYRVRVERSGSDTNLNGEICVYNTPVVCNPPTLTATTAITSNSATINWNAATPVPSTGYEYVVSTVNVAPGGAGTATTALTANVGGLAPSTTYYVFVRSDCGSGNFSSWSPSGTFTTAGTVANDLCANATALPCGTTNLAGTTIGTSDIATSNGCSIGNYGVWYTFVGDGDQTTITVDAAPGYDHEMAVVSGNCGTLTNITCEDSALSGGIESYTFITVNATTYYVYIAHYANGNTTTGDFTISRSCSPVTPPPNDECAAATVIGTNSDLSCTVFGSGSIEFATNSPGADACGGTSDDDVWFEFQATATTHTVDLINIVNGTTDLYHAVYAGSCAAPGAALVCSDPNSSLVSGLTIGNTYYVQVYSWTGTAGQTTDFDICIGTPPPPPPNDEPCTATVVTPNPDQSCTNFSSGTIEYATNTGIVASACFGTDDDDVWFEFTATSTSHTIDLYNITGGTTDLYHAIYDGPCGSITGPALLCSDPNSSSLSGLTIGNTYFVQVYSWTASSGQTSSFDICIGSPPPPPPNDACVGAIELIPDVTCNYTTYNNAAASDSGVANPGCANYQGGDLWFYVEVPPSGDLIIDSQTGTVTDSGMAVYSGTCGALTLIQCDDDSSANGLMSSITLTGQTPGEILYVRMWEYGNNNNGSFGLCVTTTIVGTNGVSICVGDPSEPLTTDITCTSAGTTVPFGGAIAGALNAATDSVASRPEIFIQSGDACSFDPQTSNYTFHDFTVTVSGTYVFAMDTPSPYFDGMGYIVNQDIGFTPGICSAGWVAGDDDDGPALDPQITANLTAGVNYRLYTTIFSFGNITHTGPFTWNVSTTTVDVEWYTTATGGTAIGSGAVFDPVGVAGSGLTDTNTAGTTSFWAGCPGGGPRTQADYVISNCTTCTEWTAGAGTSNWYTPGNWNTGIVPTAADCVIINNVIPSPILTYPGAPTPPTPGECLNLTVRPSASLEIASDKVLTVTEDVVVNAGGTFLIRSGGSLVQIDDTFSNSGDIRMERTVTGVGPQDYVYWSSPVDGQNVQLVSPGSNPGLIWEWDPTVANNYGQWLNSNDNPMLPGKGYIIRDIAGTPTADTPLFVGTARNGVITRSIERGTYTGADYIGPGDTMVTAQDDNWNLVGNPFPSAVSYSDFITNPANNTIDGTIYLWTHQNPPSNTENSPFYQDFVYNYNPNDYIDNNWTGPNPPGFNGNLAAGQAFFVLMLDTGTQSETITFNNSMRSASNTNSIFYGPPGSNPYNNDIERHRIWLDLITPDDFATSLLVGYIEGATLDDDRLYDGYEYPGTPISFYSLAVEKKMSIQGRPIPFVEEDLVPIGFTVPVNETYRIAINSVDGLFSDAQQAIYLEDTYSDVIHDLRVSPYGFTSEAGTFDDRFVLRYTNEALGTDEITDNSDLIIRGDQQGIHVSSGSLPIESIIIYDIIGRVIIDLKDVNSQQQTLNNLQLSKSAYIVKATLSNGKYKIKKVVQ